MKFSLVAILACLLAFASTSAAQRPDNITICDYYSKAIFNDTSPDHEYMLLKILVNTVVIGNYSATPTGMAVPGILANATVNGEQVSLLEYFNGSKNTTNIGGAPGFMNFLDGGGPVPLTKNLPSNDSTTCTSNQCMLLTHLYELFGNLLGCTAYNSSTFPAYAGGKSMYEVHKFMYLSNAQNLYFIQQVGAAASAYGVSKADVTGVASKLTGLFGVQCSMPASLSPGYDAAPQSICNAGDCALATPSNCSAYGVAPTDAPAPAPKPSSASKLQTVFLLLFGGTILSLLV